MPQGNTKGESDTINNMDYTSMLGIEPSSVILDQYKNQIL